MNFIHFFLNRKAQIFYSIVVLLFNVLAIYYLFFFSNSKIDLFSFFPNTNLVILAVEKPFIAFWSKLVFSKAYPSPLPTKRPVPTYNPSPTQQPNKENDLIDCIGPDGKHVFLTQKDCDTFNNAWNTATPSAMPTQSATPSGAIQ